MSKYGETASGSQFAAPEPMLGAAGNRLLGVITGVLGLDF